MTKGVLPHPKRRFAPAMGQDAHSNGKNSRVISAVYCIALWFYCHFIIRYERYLNIQIFQYKSAFKISMSKIVIYMEFKSRILLAN